jgi:hypothetical protein
MPEFLDSSEIVLSGGGQVEVGVIRGRILYEHDHFRS